MFFFFVATIKLLLLIFVVVFLIGFCARPSVVPAVSRRGDDVRSRIDHNVQTAGTNSNRKQGRRIRWKFVSLLAQTITILNRSNDFLKVLIIVRL